MGDGHILVVEWGAPAAPPILLLHGWQSDHRSWSKLVPYLAGEYRVIALDFRGGTGESSPPPGGGEGTWDTTVEDVAAAVRWCGSSRPLLVGASWGGKIGLVYAARGNACAGVVCVDGMAYGDQGTLREDTYARVGCPLKLIIAKRGVYPREGARAFVERHPELDVTWLPCGHEVQEELPQELAETILDLAAAARPG